MVLLQNNPILYPVSLQEKHIDFILYYIVLFAPLPKTRHELATILDITEISKKPVLIKNEIRSFANS